ncbi:MAG: GNAT family N-acetyltransferase [Acidobacteria bacterium]|nr:GNAT family N-acetyltransferase [Acidobacteriota bacterium]
MRVRRGEYEIDTDKRRLDIAAIHRFLSQESYWAKKRPLEKTLTAIENSLCFGIYKGREQVGFARLVTDKATFAYVGDVYVVEPHRGKGLSKWLLQVMTEQPDLQGMRRWLLATRDAHGLYKQHGFSALVHPDRWMERTSLDAY